MRLSAIFLCFSSLIATAYAAPPSTLVDLGYAQYQGSLNNATGNIQFLGIRFAAAPTGTLRWSAPQLPQTTPGIQQANTLPNTCQQAGSGVQAVTPFHSNSGSLQQKRAAPSASEDCLFLNVVTPASGTKSLPVVVWIHGGGYEGGSGASFDGNNLVQQAGGGVVTVVIQYRLGLFGFLAEETNPPLFRAAITSSTFLPSQYAFNDPVPEQLFSEVVQSTGCSSATDTLACLRQVDVNVLEQANTNISGSGFFGTFLFVPVVDGHFITERPTQLLRQGKVNGQAFLSMTNTFEGANFVNMATAATVQTPTYLANLFPDFTGANVTAGTAQYSNQGAPIDQVVGIMGESIFICPTYFLLRAFGNKGFKGEFAVPPGGHGQDVNFYFPSAGAPSFNNTIFINNFAQSFMDFAMSLDPNIKWDPANTVPRWARWSEQSRNEMLFNRTNAGVPVFQSVTTSAALIERCE
ncbi:alpha/beta-hydrolase [Macrolepiota fuliginosa MF-IS2]|uniref:Alpha/beta-hydrolase n=1 Tax=Macrolepiota fuliginosa MF-IS2 TaxID=1400762 RepID=A0A9P6BZ88_9AGAR|nr:alpha/beta-hydrolase [Macrolepiota fuliginosa MF-IS2]